MDKALTIPGTTIEKKERNRMIVPVNRQGWLNMIILQRRLIKE